MTAITLAPRTGAEAADLIEEGGRRVALAVLSAPPADSDGLARVAALAYAHVTAN